MKNVKAVLAKPGLDPHWRGIMIVANILRKNGFNVIYLGNSLPNDILQVAIEEDVKLIGLSSLGGAHLTLGKEMIELMVKNDVLKSIAIVMGGVIPPDDERELLKVGFDNIFGPGSTEKEIISKINSSLKKKGTI